MHSKKLQPILIAGKWRPADLVDTFYAINPMTKEVIDLEYPISSIRDIETAVCASSEASEQLLRISPLRIADFLEIYAGLIEKRKDELVDMAHEETALPKTPRLKDAELLRTTDQLRQSAVAARDGSWKMPTIDAKQNIRSLFAPLGGGVVVFGPNNFPFAFNSISGGDFAAAIAAGNPVIAKANPSHPSTTRLLAEEAFRAVKEAKLPLSSVQLLYGTSYEDGEKMVSHPLIGATAYTGSKKAGLRLKAAADRAGKPIYLEMSSINPVIILRGALLERREEIVNEFMTSFLMGTGQFCTNPGFVLIQKGKNSEAFIRDIKKRLEGEPAGTLLGKGVEKNLSQSVNALKSAGAKILTGGFKADRQGYGYQNTLLTISGKKFLKNPKTFQQEAFGNATLFVLAEDFEETIKIVRSLEGNLTGSVYTHREGGDDKLYNKIAPILRVKVGRLLNDKMPTGVAVSPAMNHGGPYPATGHPGFTSVGIPASMLRFAMLQCFDSVRGHRLPPELRDKNPGRLWRKIDGEWTQGDVRRKDVS